MVDRTPATVDDLQWRSEFATITLKNRHKKIAKKKKKIEKKITSGGWKKTAPKKENKYEKNI